MAETCKILFWNLNGHVRGLVAARDSRGGLKILASAAGNATLPFPLQLREVDAALRHSQAEAVLAGGFVRDFVCCEFPMPNHPPALLRNAVRMELSRHFPLSSAELVFGFRPIPIPDSPHQVRVRVFAVRTGAYDELIGKLKESGLRFDAFCHPFMAAEIDREHPRAVFPDTAPGLEMVMNDAALAEMCVGTEEPSPDRTGEVLAACALGRRFRQDKKYLSPLPEELRLRHFKKSRRLLILLFLLMLTLAGSLGWRYWSDGNQRLRRYRRAEIKLSEELRVRNGRLEEIRNLNQFARKMSDAIDTPPVLPVLEELSQRLPLSAWVTAFRSGGGKIALTVSVTGDGAPVDAALAELDGWMVENQRQQQGADGAETRYITLRRK